MTGAVRHAWIAFAALLAALVAALLLAAPPGQPAAAPGSADRGLARAIEVQERHTDRLLARPGVVGTAVGVDASGTPVVRVYTKHRGVSVRGNLNGVGVSTAVTGAISALHHRDGHGGGPPGGGGGDDGDSGGSTEPARTDRWPRPVPIGISTGTAEECSAGTIGARVSGGGVTYALSNNHVYAMENDGHLGDRILQPGRYDLNCAEPTGADDLGTLSAFVELDFDGGDNVVDAAVAATTVGDLRTSTPSDGYGAPLSTTAAAAAEQSVQKYGRTTGLTRGVVDGINGDVNVGYSSGTARFVDQIFVSSRPGFIRSGDSGSLLVTDPGRAPVGLLFAGDSPGKFAVANPIDAVLTELGGELGDELSIDGE